MAKIIEINTDGSYGMFNKEILEEEGHEYIRLANAADWFEYYAGLNDSQKGEIDGIIINEVLAAVECKPPEEFNEHDNRAIRLIGDTDNYFKAVKLAREITTDFSRDKISYPSMLLTHNACHLGHSFNELCKLKESVSGVDILDCGDRGYSEKIKQFAVDSSLTRGNSEGKSVSLV